MTIEYACNACDDKIVDEEGVSLGRNKSGLMTVAGGMLSIFKLHLCRKCVDQVVDVTQRLPEEPEGWTNQEIARRLVLESNLSFEELETLLEVYENKPVCDLSNVQALHLIGVLKGLQEAGQTSEDNKTLKDARQRILELLDKLPPGHRRQNWLTKYVVHSILELPSEKIVRVTRELQQCYDEEIKYADTKTKSKDPYMRVLELFDELPLGHCQQLHWLKKYNVASVVGLTRGTAIQLVTDLESLLHEKTEGESVEELVKEASE